MTMVNLQMEMANLCLKKCLTFAAMSLIQVLTQKMTETRPQNIGNN